MDKGVSLEESLAEAVGANHLLERFDFYVQGERTGSINTRKAYNTNVYEFLRYMLFPPFCTLPMEYLEIGVHAAYLQHLNEGSETHEGLENKGESFSLVPYEGRILTDQRDLSKALGPKIILDIRKNRFSMRFKVEENSEKSNEISNIYKLMINYLVDYYDPGPVDLRDTNRLSMDQRFWQAILRRDRIGKYQGYLRQKKSKNCKNGNCENTISRKLAAISKFVGFLIYNEGLLDLNDDPFHRKKRPVLERNPQRFFSEEELNDIYSRIENKAREKGRIGYIGKRDLAMFSLATSRLLRASAVCNLKIKDIDFRRRTFTVVEKGKKKRTFTLDDRAYRDLKSFLDESKDRENEHIFLTERGNPMHHRCWHRILGEYSSEELSPHDLRRSIANIMHRKGYDIFMLQRLLGHKNIQTTAIYLDLDSLDFEEHIRDFNPFA